MICGCSCKYLPPSISSSASVCSSVIGDFLHRKYHVRKPVNSVTNFLNFFPLTFIGNHDEFCAAIAQNAANLHGGQGGKKRDRNRRPAVGRRSRQIDPFGRVFGQNCHAFAALPSPTCLPGCGQVARALGGGFVGEKFVLSFAALCGPDKAAWQSRRNERCANSAKRGGRLSEGSSMDLSPVNLNCGAASRCKRINQREL